MPHLRTAILLLAAGLAWPPNAAAKPAATTQVLVARWSAHFNRHSTGHRHASDRSVEALVRVSLLPKRRIEIADTGKRAHSSMGPRSYSGERLEWSNRWKGSYRHTRGGLVLSLRLNRRRCKKTLSRRFGAHNTVTKKKCPKAARSLRMRCSSATVEARPADDAKPGSKTTKEPVWRCYPLGEGRTHGSNAPWVLGRKRCIEQYTMRRIRYRICAKPKPKTKP